MGIRFSCPNGHKLNVKGHLAGKRAICPQCGSKVIVPNVPAVEEHPVRTTTPVTHAATQSAYPALDVGTADVLPSSILPHSPAEHVQAPVAAPGALPESILAATHNAPGMDVADANSDDPAIQSRRSHGRRNQLVVSVVLLLIVVLLAVALYWVITRPVPPAVIEAPPPTTPAAESTPAQSTAATTPATPEMTTPTATAPDPAAKAPASSTVDVPATPATGTAAPSEPAPKKE